MSTKAIIDFKKNNESLLKLYKHWNGDPEYLGYDIANFLANINFTNGITGTSKLYENANGYSDLILQFISYFKDRPGDLYLGEGEGDYFYTIHCNENKLYMEVGGFASFYGTPQEYLDTDIDDMKLYEEDEINNYSNGI